MTTYGDTLASWMNGSASTGSGLWAFLLLLLVLLGLVAAAIILIRTVKTAIDSA